MKDMYLLRTLLSELSKADLEALVLLILPGTTLPKGSRLTLTARLVDWVHGDVAKRMRVAVEAIADSILTRKHICGFLRTPCRIKVLSSASKEALSARLVAELCRDATPVEPADAVDHAGRADPTDTNVAEPADAVDWTGRADPAHGDDIGGTIVAAGPAKRVCKHLRRAWIKGGRALRRKIASAHIKRAIAAYTLIDNGNHTLQQVRRDIEQTVGMSLESGQARVFFERRLALHLGKMKPKVRRRRSKWAPGPRHNALMGDAERQRYETLRMAYEDAFSESL